MTRRGRALSALLLWAAVLAVLVWFFAAVGNVGRGNSQQGRQQLETALRRGAVAYYAAEGVYPPTLDALTQRSGIQIDEEYYSVFYEIFADNLMPDITVLVNET
ncbi:MAG: hypothetical protein J6A62_01525 [Oscillospiraceae bacterium]|nr:hypothetical protein [Oscillospiraceae bacterium]